MTRLVVLPYLQRWMHQRLAIRVLVAPQGDPLQPLLPGAPPFTTAALELEVRLVQGLAALPSLGGAFTAVPVASPAPAQSTAICNALAAAMPVDPTLPPVDLRSRGMRILKYAPPAYREATGMAAGASPYVVTDDRFRCALRDPVPSGTRIKVDPPKFAWGNLMAFALRQPLLAEAVGLVRKIDVAPPPGFFDEGGWVYVTIGAGGDAAALATTPGALRLYAARVPPLAEARDLFTSVLFPVAATPPAASYDELFQEVIEYDDGFAKAVYAAQQRQLDPWQEDADGSRPAEDRGIQIGWDDEQVARWLNRPVDPSLALQDAPTGVIGYRVDVRKPGKTWRSLVRGKTRLVIDDLDLGARTGELHVEVAPGHLAGDQTRTYWMPTYFTSWRGPALVGADPIDLAMLVGTAQPLVAGIPPGVTLRYGGTYELRARLVDATGGGPELSAQPRHPSVHPVARITFQRWIRPGPIAIESQHPVLPDPKAPPKRIDVARPRLGYPAFVFAGGAAADLLADIPAAKAERRPASGPDPDVVEVEITVEVEDPRGFVPVYRTTRRFPEKANKTLQLDLDWRDVKDAATLTAPAKGKLPVPTARTVRVGLAALGRDKPEHFAAEDVRRGPITCVALRAPSADERSLWRPFAQSDALRAIFLRPDANAIGRLAAELELEIEGNALRARRGQRVLFGGSAVLRHVIGPDGASITFASVADLPNLWLVAVRVTLDRDWSWDGLTRVDIERNGTVVGRIEPRRSIGHEARAGASPATSDVVYIDAIDPKPAAGAFPREIDLTYRLVPSFRTKPSKQDAPITLAIRVPITTPPSQVPRIVSAGLALSPYQRSADYARTEPRHRLLWLEFADPPADPHDGYFARVLARAPDPALLDGAHALAEAEEPPLPIDPEPIRTIVPGQSDDGAGLAAMQALIATDSPHHFLLPLPPGLTEGSADLFGFFAYELRVGHRQGWSTAQGRYGRARRLDGVQHPAPALACQVIRTREAIEITAPFATPVHGGRSLRPSTPVTKLWALLYAQVVQADGDDRRNLLLDTRAAPSYRDIATAGTALWTNAEIAELCRLVGLTGDAPLSCVVVETLPADQPVENPVSLALGYERFLRTSPLTPIPLQCG